MRKEVFYAIIAGISIGLVAAFGTWKISRLVKVTPTPIIIDKTPTPTITNKIIINDLKDYDVVIENPIINGLAAPNIDIVISTYEKDFYTKSNSKGEFEKEIELPTGLSEILVNNQKLILVFSIDAQRMSKSYVGTVTDISSGTIQIKNSSGNILQISTSEETKYINNLKKGVEVKQTDLAIGDYIVAIGTLNGNKVLHSAKILVTSPLPENKIKVEKIIIDKLTKTKINDITLPKTWVGPNVKDLEVGQEIIVVGTKNEDKFDLRSIFVVE